MNHQPRVPTMASSAGNTTGSGGVHQSAKMMDAQASFQRVVKQELQVLLLTGLEREVAVKVLLHRIVESTQEPEESDVKRVMKQFQMNYDDAVRALIVKQEIGRLKRQGLDAFAAIEELTRKMQRMSGPGGSSDDDEEEKEQDEEKKDAAQDENDAMGDTSQRPPLPTLADEGSIQTGHTQETTTDDSTDSKTNPDQETNENVESDEMKEKSVDPLSSSSLSLCQRIDQVSISSSSSQPDETTTTSTRNESSNSSTPPSPSSASSSLSTTHPAAYSKSAFTLFSAHSRKRRVANAGGTSSPMASDREEPSGPTSNHRAHLSIHRPMSPTFRFPTSKKQKLWSDEENNSSKLLFDDESARSTPASPTAVSSNSNTVGSETPTSSSTITSATPTKVGKRRRIPRSATSSPELDEIEIDVEDPMVRVAKRHKL